ncbi:PIN domain nuclease, a component of toxin-antitoxin system (PIN domain) [Modestobacter sp. DSM 44400]|uniref:type II toxin-antitoxin system VapC family toxin n=1 Tax=Modestobacter sp. DSM 44400 TaxID=1550230 RepID=UPI00089CD772|nr:type II toxin-antitoxin system VapC family toxin [Modestobacter sp. DSM 44400]SDY32917.1 PIN domain nuclease, a component of toxin-antitoxin system (PIN domain) [Modestobacter sp. DSM 44400]
MNLFDSSALLCFLQGGFGADRVEEVLVGEPAVCSAANWSETAQKVLRLDGDWPSSRALLLSYQLTVEPVTREDAEAAAALWRRNSGLSLADRICLATGRRLAAVVWTADRAWGESDLVRQIR